MEREKAESVAQQARLRRILSQALPGHLIAFKDNSCFMSFSILDRDGNIVVNFPEVVYSGTIACTTDDELKEMILEVKQGGRR